MTRQYISEFSGGNFTKTFSAETLIRKYPSLGRIKPGFIQAKGSRPVLTETSGSFERREWK